MKALDEGRMRLVRVSRLCMLALCLLVVAGPGFAQVNATLTGSVSDPSGAAIPEVSVTATNISTATSTKVVSDAAGMYVFLSLPPAVYNITAEKSGFKSKTTTGVQLLVDQKATLDLQLEVGRVVESVQVKGETSIVQTNTATISTVIGTTQTTDLPLNLRRFGSLAYLMPSSVTALDRGGSAVSFSAWGVGTAYASNGARTSGNNIMVDGVMTKTLASGGFGIQPTPDAVQEFRIQTNVYSAEYVGSPGTELEFAL